MANQPNDEIATNDGRILNADWRNNRLVATHNIGLATDSVSHVRWYEFATAGFLPTLTQSGTLDPGTDTSTYFPSIAIAPNGDIGMTYMQSSATEYISMYVTGQKQGAIPGTTQRPILIKAGEATNQDSGEWPYRAGDFSGIGVDPDTGTFWAGNEYATSNLPGSIGGTWGTWIAQFSFEAPAAFRLEAPAFATIGATFFVTARAVDPYGNALTSYRGTVHFSSSDSLANLPVDYTFTAADNGVHTFSVTLNSENQQVVTITDPNANLLARAATVNVYPLATHINLVAPTDSVAGSSIPITLTARDAAGNVDTAYTGTVRFFSGDVQAVLPADYTFTPGDAGVLVVPLTLKTAGTESITVVDTFVPTLIGSTSVAVSPAAAGQFRVQSYPIANVGSSLTFTVTASIPISILPRAIPGWYPLTAIILRLILCRQTTLSRQATTASIRSAWRLAPLATTRLPCEIQLRPRWPASSS